MCHTGAVILATDVHYEGESARAAGVLFSAFTDSEPLHTEVREQTGFGEYAAGEFFRRELPCILPLITEIHERVGLSAIVVDGYVDLGPSHPGLGRYVFDALGGTVRIIGVAKSDYRGAPSRSLYRGESKRALYITCTGDVDEATREIASMSGAFRLPALLKHVDQLARGHASPC